MRATRVPLAGLVLLLAVVVGAEADVRTIELALHGGRLPDDRRVIRVQRGDEVTLWWTSDRRCTLHLHGYDLETALAPGVPAAMRFTARATGRFPIELHGPGGDERTVGYLEVHPR